MDQIYRPISDTDEESETHATTEMPIESWDKFKDRLEKAADVSHDDLTPEEAADSIRQRRAEAPSPENASARPIVVHKSKGDGPKTLKQATEDLAFSRGLAKREELLASGYTEEEVQQLGRDNIAAAQRGDPRDPLPIEVLPGDKWGEEGKALTVEEASRRLTDWRAEQEAQRQSELAALTGEHAARQYEEFQAQQQPEPEQQPEPQQPDPVQQEREQVTQERQRTEAIKQLSFHEVAGLNNLAQLSQQVQQAFPELAQVRTEQDLHALHAHLQAKNPARAQALVRADQVVRQRQVALAHLTMTRKAHEAHQQQSVAQQRAQAAAQHDAAFEARAATIVPNWEQARPAMQAAAKQTLIAAGISEEQIDQLWRRGTPIDIRSSAAQELILKASLWDNAKQKAQTIRESNLPRVIRPGVGRSHVNAGMEHVSNLQAKLKTAKGNKAIQIGAELLKARREMNGG
jgi:hypothetical protein